MTDSPLPPVGVSWTTPTAPHGHGTIEQFTGEHAFLSNFHPNPLFLGGMTYLSAEHAFNAAKSLDPAEAAWVRQAPTPGEAKARGRRVTLRPGWDERERFVAMDAVVAAKFADPNLRDALCSTGNTLLVEGTTWHDQTWGDCMCEKHRPWPGANHLGRLLMAERARLTGAPPDRWVRVAVTGHRPQHLTSEQAAWAQSELDRLAVKLRDHHGTQVAITGAALGADIWWARSARRAELTLWAYVPFQAQADRWPAADGTAWAKMLQVAERRLVLGTGYDVRLLHARNGFMIRDADLVVAVHDPAERTGGTASAVRAARAAGRPLVLVDVVGRRTTVEPGSGPVAP